MIYALAGRPLCKGRPSGYNRLICSGLMVGAAAHMILVSFFTGYYYLI